MIRETQGGELHVIPVKILKNLPDLDVLGCEVLSIMTDRSLMEARD